MTSLRSRWGEFKRSTVPHWHISLRGYYAAMMALPVTAPDTEPEHFKCLAGPVLNTRRVWVSTAGPLIPRLLNRNHACSG